MPLAPHAPAAEIGRVHGEFKLAGENFRNGSAAFRAYDASRKGAATIYEVTRRSLARCTG